MAEHIHTGDEPEAAVVTPVEAPPEAPPEADDHFVPRGAFYFALVLIIGYVIYYFLTYYEVVILRGGA
jgi:hypothetical protein